MPVVAKTPSELNERNAVEWNEMRRKCSELNLRNAYSFSLLKTQDAVQWNGKNAVSTHRTKYSALKEPSSHESHRMLFTVKSTIVQWDVRVLRCIFKNWTFLTVRQSSARWHRKTNGTEQVHIEGWEPEGHKWHFWWNGYIYCIYIKWKLLMSSFYRQKYCHPWVYNFLL